MDDPLSIEYVDRLPPIARGFYQRATIEVAPWLLGKLLVRRISEGLVGVRIVEVEAYLGRQDPACHTYGGRRTPRNEVMWGEAGHLYVYFVYGMHHCANVVTRGIGHPEAVLLRGAVPVFGYRLIKARRKRFEKQIINGPAKLCQGLGIDRSLNGADLAQNGDAWLVDDGFSVELERIRRTPRIGVDYAGEAANWPLSFVLDGVK